jgi:hypothetical protein
LRRRANAKYVFKSSELQTCPIFERDRLLAGNEVWGPAVIEQADSTTWCCLHSRWSPHGRLIMTQNAAADYATQDRPGKTSVSQESGWLARLIYPKNTDGGEMHERHTT